MIDLKIGVHRPAIELVPGGRVHAVGVMVAGQADHRVLQLPRLFQLLQRIGQSLVQFHVAGEVGGGLLAHVQFRHLGLMLDGHGVAGEVVVHVAADRHVVVMERLLPRQGLGDGTLHHLQVGLRPALRHLQPVAQGVKIVAHVGVGEIPIVIGPGMVVVGGGRIALVPQHPAHAEGHVVPGRGLEGPPGAGGDQRGAHRILSVGGGLPPQGSVEIFKDKALVGQLPKRGGIGLVHRIFPKALGGDEQQVFPRKPAGILIFQSGGPLAEILVQLRHRGVGLLRQQPGKVDVQHIGRIGGLPGLRRGLRPGQQLRADGHRRGGPPHRRFKLQLRQLPRQELLGVQAQGGQHAEVRHRELGLHRPSVELAGGLDASVTSRHGQHGGELDYRCPHQQAGRQGPGGMSKTGRAGGPLPAPLPAAPPLPQAQQQQRHGQQGQDGQRPQNAREGHRPVVGHGASRQGDGIQRQKGLEHPEVGSLGHIPHRQQPGEEKGSPPVAPGTPQAGQNPAGQPAGQAEQEGVGQPAPGQSAHTSQPDHAFQPQDGQRELERPCRDLPSVHARPPFSGQIVAMYCNTKPPERKPFPPLSLLTPINSIHICKNIYKLAPPVLTNSVEAI